MEGMDRFRSSTTGWLLGTLAGWGTLLLIPAGIILSVLDLGLGLGWWPLLLVAVALLVVAWKWITFLDASYEVTPDRLVIRRGIFVKSIDEIELYRIKDIRIDFTLINQVANVGTLSITSSDETTRDAPLQLSLIKNARARRERLRDLVDAARQRRRVREIDMVHDEL
jgi:uncharacterized membrane protein YdbT with pleckstrin-like domain